MNRKRVEIVQTAIAVCVVVLFVAIVVSVFDVGYGRSYWMFPEAGDWKIQTDGVDYRWATLDSAGNWVPGKFVSHDRYDVSVDAKRNAPRKEWK